MEVRLHPGHDMIFRHYTILYICSTPTLSLSFVSDPRDPPASMVSGGKGRMEMENGNGDGNGSGMGR